jgi:hypothetical protein
MTSESVTFFLDGGVRSISELLVQMTKPGVPICARLNLHGGTCLASPKRIGMSCEYDADCRSVYRNQ